MSTEFQWLYPCFRGGVVGVIMRLEVDMLLKGYFEEVTVVGGGVGRGDEESVVKE